ncbi:MAG: response regulator [Pseudomonadales bacterium]|nr:response regulator [Pseudomonadales bacterium]
MSTNILLIDDDSFLHKMVRRALEPHGFVLRTALDGELGIKAALEEIPDIILLDVEMPGLNGYEVCEKLRNTEQISEIPIVFLSGRSDMRERLLGYEVGADDYMTKPFEADHLVARLRVLSRYSRDRLELRAQYLLAKSTAMTAMSGTSEIAIAMQFMEHSISYTNIEETIEGLLETTDQFSIECCICVFCEDGEILWFSSEGTISPIEKELISEGKRDSRFVDFGSKTVVNYPDISMLVKNMPLEDMERYGRLKDLLPVLISTVNTKLNAIKTHHALIGESDDLKSSFTEIRANLFKLASTIVENRTRSTELIENTTHNMSMNLLRMGLDEDQEVYLLEEFSSAFTNTLAKIDLGAQMKQSFSSILDNLETTMTKHDVLLDSFIAGQQAAGDHNLDGVDDGIELF